MKKISYEIKEKNEIGANYNVTIKIPMEMGYIENVYFIIENSKKRNYITLEYKNCENDMAVFEKDILLNTCAIYHYHFTFTANGREMKHNGSKMSVNFKVPDWAKGKIMYHIFVDRFNKKDENIKEMKNRIYHRNWNEDMLIGPDKNGRWNTDFYGGNLKGIIEKLDYIKSLGTTIIYLSPICTSQSNHRYDTANYKEIDPYVGTEEDLIELCEKAHSKGMKIILDAVFNHTGNDSIYFNEYGTYNTLGAYQSKESPYYNFYRKSKGNFDYWWGMKNLPVCDGNSKQWQDYIYGEGGIIDKWFKCGIDGLRLDVADELTDEFIEGIRKAVKRNKKDAYILGEVWENPMRMNRSYIESGKAMDSVMNYQLVDALIRYFKYADTQKIIKIINEIKNEYPKETMLSLMNFTSTHDISRAINIFSSDRFKLDGQWAWNLKDENYEKSKNYHLTQEEYKKGLEIYKAYIFTLTFLPGNLSIFYGDEIGMEGEGNLSNRRPFTWDNIDYDLLKYFKYIGHIRNNEPLLEKAKFEIIDITDKLMMFERGEEILTVINRTNEEIDINLPKEYQKSSKTYSIRKTNKYILTPHNGLSIKK